MSHPPRNVKFGSTIISVCTSINEFLRRIMQLCVTLLCNAIRGSVLSGRMLSANALRIVLRCGIRATDAAEIVDNTVL